MRPTKHTIVSVSIGAAMWFFTKSIYAGILSFASGILVDFDHFIEYIVHYGWKDLSFKKVYKACEQTETQNGDYRFKKIYLVLHTMEIVILLWMVTIYTKNTYLLAIAVGYSSHLILDYIGNKWLNPFTYFMFWRAIKKFEYDKLFKKINGNI